MNVRTVVAAAMAAAMMTITVSLFAADQPSPSTVRKSEPIYGYRMMSNDERNDYRKRMREARSAQERQAIRDEHRKLMESRAKERGVTLPERRGPGAGPMSGTPGAGMESGSEGRGPRAGSGPRWDGEGGPGFGKGKGYGPGGKPGAGMEPGQGPRGEVGPGLGKGYGPGGGRRADCPAGQDCPAPGAGKGAGPRR